jgi:hypothetical protein
MFLAGRKAAPVPRVKLLLNLHLHPDHPMSWRRPRRGDWVVESSGPTTRRATVRNRPSCSLVRVVTVLAYRDAK